MNKNKTPFNSSKPKKHKKRFDPYMNSTVSNSGKEIYTYTKHKKPKRIGKECIYFIQEKLTCKLSHQFCKDADKCNSFKYKDTIPLHKNKTISNTVKYKKDNISDVGITAIVLNDNRKCTYENHHIQDIQAKIRISLKSSGEIITYNIPAAYCNICDAYFILKKDFKTAKDHGIILCPVIDRTQKYLTNSKIKNQIGNESRIHQLGYNVVKGNGYTDKQRHVVLANIIENTDISKFEILSNIRRCISQHKNQLNYSDSVKCWQNDLEFVLNYLPGDMPEVQIKKIIVGKRE